MTYHSHDIVFVEFFDGTYQVVIDFAYISSSGDKHYSGTLISGSERTFSERQIV